LRDFLELDFLDLRDFLELDDLRDFLELDLRDFLAGAADFVPFLYVLPARTKTSLKDLLGFFLRSACTWSIQGFPILI
jgi:hypothetical protein